MPRCITCNTCSCNTLHNIIYNVRGRKGHIMEQKNELKPKSFRISDEISEKFKEISAQIGGNQQETMQYLINAYYMQEKKVNLSDYKANIETFEQYTTSLITLYTESLESNKATREAVMQECSATLTSKDKIIEDLQAKCERAEQEQAQAEEQKQTAEKNLKQAFAEITKLQQELEEQTKDHAKQVQTLEESKNSLSELCANLNKQLAEVEPMKEQLKELNGLKAELSDLKAQLKEKELEHKQKLLDMQEKMQQDKMQQLAEIEAYQKKYKELLEKQEQQEHKSDTE